MKIDTRFESDRCQPGAEVMVRLDAHIPAVVQEITASCRRGDCFDHIDPPALPRREEVANLVQMTRRILFLGYFNQTRIDQVNLEYYLGQEVSDLFENLSIQVACSIRHDCLRYDRPCTECTEQGNQVALHFIRALPALRALLARDVRAAYEGDPASQSYDEIIFSYPGLLALTVYRMAHILHEQDVPLLPRTMTEYAHSQTGIDIHPGAKIGNSFFIDHGTGVVVGETTRIGDRVRLYQGVTLGALSVPAGTRDQLKGKKRHPTIEDDVIIYSGATILGGETVMGARSIIGGNVWLTESVPPDTKVFLKPPELIFIGPGAEKQTIQSKRRRQR